MDSKNALNHLKTWTFDKTVSIDLLKSEAKLDSARFVVTHFQKTRMATHQLTL